METVAGVRGNSERARVECWHKSASSVEKKELFWPQTPVKSGSREGFAAHGVLFVPRLLLAVWVKHDHSVADRLGRYTVTN